MTETENNEAADDLAKRLRLLLERLLNNRQRFAREGGRGGGQRCPERENRDREGG